MSMLCPKCASESRVLDSRDNRRSIRRRRACMSCPNRWSTFEVLFESGMDPYPMCKIEGCFRPKAPTSKYASCKAHSRQQTREYEAQERILRVRRTARKRRYIETNDRKVKP